MILEILEDDNRALWLSAINDLIATTDALVPFLALEEENLGEWVVRTNAAFSSLRMLAPALDIEDVDIESATPDTYGTWREKLNTALATAYSLGLQYGVEPPEGFHYWLGGLRDGHALALLGSDLATAPSATPHASAVPAPFLDDKAGVVNVDAAAALNNTYAASTAFIFNGFVRLEANETEFQKIAWVGDGVGSAAPKLAIKATSTGTYIQGTVATAVSGSDVLIDPLLTTDGNDSVLLGGRTVWLVAALSPDGHILGVAVNGELLDMSASIYTRTGKIAVAEDAPRIYESDSWLLLGTDATRYYNTEVGAYQFEPVGTTVCGLSHVGITGVEFWPMEEGGGSLLRGTTRGGLLDLEDLTGYEELPEAFVSWQNDLAPAVEDPAEGVVPTHNGRFGYKDAGTLLIPAQRAAYAKKTYWSPGSGVGLSTAAKWATVSGGSRAFRMSFTVDVSLAAMQESIVHMLLMSLSDTEVPSAYLQYYLVRKTGATAGLESPYTHAVKLSISADWRSCWGYVPLSAMSVEIPVSPTAPVKIETVLAKHPTIEGWLRLELWANGRMYHSWEGSAVATLDGYTEPTLFEHMNAQGAYGFKVSGCGAHLYDLTIAQSAEDGTVLQSEGFSFDLGTLVDPDTPGLYFTSTLGSLAQLEEPDEGPDALWIPTLPQDRLSVDVDGNALTAGGGALHNGAAFKLKWPELVAEATDLDALATWGGWSLASDLPDMLARTNRTDHQLDQRNVSGTVCVMDAVAFYDDDTPQEGVDPLPWAGEATC